MKKNEPEGFFLENIRADAIMIDTILELSTSAVGVPDQSENAARMIGWCTFHSGRPGRGAMDHCLLLKTSNANGIVLIAPTRNNLHPIFFRLSSLRISARKESCAHPKHYASAGYKHDFRYGQSRFLHKASFDQPF